MLFQLRFGAKVPRINFPNDYATLNAQLHLAWCVNVASMAKMMSMKSDVVKELIKVSKFSCDAGIVSTSFVTFKQTSTVVLLQVIANSRQMAVNSLLNHGPEFIHFNICILFIS